MDKHGNNVPRIAAIADYHTRVLISTEKFLVNGKAPEQGCQDAFMNFLVRSSCCFPLQSAKDSTGIKQS